MKILYIPSLNISTIYYRIENPASQIVKQKKHSVHVEYFDLDINNNQNWECLLHNKNTDESKNITQILYSAFIYFDIIITQKLQDFRTISLFKKLKKENPNVKLYIDCDDSIYSNSQSSIIEIPEWFNEQNRKFIKLCDGVIVTTEYLKSEILSINPNIHVMPNFIRKEEWTHIRKEKDNIKRIGFIGASGHDQDLECIWSELIKLLNDNKNLRLIIRYGGYRPKFIKDHPQLDYENLSCHISKYSSKISDLNLDLFIAPLRDLSFNRCKSELKILEALNFDTPIVCSNIITFNNFNTKGLKGVFYANRKEWGSKIIEALNYDYKKNSLKYKVNSKNNYSPRNIVDELISFFEKEIVKKVDKPLYAQTKYSYII